MSSSSAGAISSSDAAEGAGKTQIVRAKGGFSRIEDAEVDAECGGISSTDPGTTTDVISTTTGSSIPSEASSGVEMVSIALAAAAVTPEDSDLPSSLRQ